MSSESGSVAFTGGPTDLPAPVPCPTERGTSASSKAGAVFDEGLLSPIRAPSSAEADLLPPRRSEYSTVARR